MRTFLHRFAVVAVVLAWAHTSSAQTADEIIEKSITAMGGRAAMEKIKTRSMSGTIILSTPGGAIPGTIDIQNAVPNKVRTVIKADLTSLGAGPMLIDQRFDGTTAYVLDNLQGDRPITGNQLENMKINSFPHAYLNYKAVGLSVKLVGKEKVGVRDVFVISFEPASADASTIKQYVDAETYLPIRTVLAVDVPQVGKVDQTSEASDFRAVDGVKVPFKLQISSSVQALTITFSKIENNVAIDEKFFAKQ